MSVDIIAVEDPSRAFHDTIETLIDATAAKLGYPFDPVPCQLKALDDNGDLVGGLTAHVLQGWLYVKLLGVAEGRRGGGIGRKLLARAEDFARERNLVGVYLDTFEFQAPRFYEGLGYSECGRLPAHRGAPQRIWLAKTFEAPAGE